MSCTSVASIVYDVPDELGLATWIWSLNAGLTDRPSTGSGMFFFFSWSVL
jgi:hypothetical protein